MALGIQYEQGEFENRPYLMFNAKAGRFYAADREDNGGGFETVKRELDPGWQAAMDFGSIETGWLLFAPGVAPSIVTAPLGTAIPPKPSDKHKMGFKLILVGKVLGGPREFTSTAKAVIGSIDGVHSHYEAAPEAAAGKIPLVKMVRTFEVVSDYKDERGAPAKTVNYAPVWEIVGWVDRPASLGERTVPPPSGARPAPVAVAPAPSRHVAAPVPVQQAYVAPAPAPAKAELVDDEIPW